MKKNQKLLEMMNELDEKYIEEAEKASFLPQKNIWKRVGSIAASLALVAAIGTFPIWGNFNNSEIGPEIVTPTAGNGESVEYVWDAEKGIFTLKKDTDISDDGNERRPTNENTNIPELSAETFEEMQGEDVKLTPNVLYPYITGEFADYGLTTKTVSPNYVGESLGAVTMRGEDGKTLEAELFAIVGVDAKCAVAVKYPQYVYRVFRNPDITFDTFAEFKAAYSLDTELYMGSILVEYIYATQEQNLVDFFYDLSSLKNLIFELDGKVCTYDEFAEYCDMAKSIGVKVAHGSQFVRSGGLQVFADGYLVTNLDGMLRIFDIGEDSAKAIIADVEENKYDCVEIYTEKRDVIEMNTVGEPSLPETSGGYYGVLETAVEETTGLTTPSYNPNEKTTAKPPHMPETIPETAPESTTEYETEYDFYDTNQPSYEGEDPYAW